MLSRQQSSLLIAISKEEVIFKCPSHTKYFSSILV